MPRLFVEEVTLCCLPWQGGCGTRPGRGHTTSSAMGLEQSSPKSSCQTELLGETHGEVHSADARALQY